MWRDIKQIVQTHSRFLLTTHVNPDGDGIGSATALLELLLRMGKKACFVTDSPIPKKFAFLNFHQLHSTFTDTADFLDVEVVFVLDVHRKDRLGRVSAMLELPGVISVCIDHHIVTEPFTPFNAIDPKACSVGAMIYDLYAQFDYKLDQRAAFGIYTSVICDTGRFSYASTDRISHKIADECMQLGVDPDDMHSRLFQHVPLSEIRMFARSLQRMDLDFNKLIEDVECVVLLRELPDHSVRVSVRSAHLDIGQVMRSIGGGGHYRAAGWCSKGTLEEVKATLLPILTQALVKMDCQYLPMSANPNERRVCGS